jgi:hypothetical protein
VAQLEPRVAIDPDMVAAFQLAIFSAGNFFSWQFFQKT